MSVTDITLFQDGHYVPFRGLAKGVQPAGSYSANMTGTGDGSGGTVNLQMSMRAIEFGMHCILTMVLVETNDNLTSAVEVLFQYSATPGNERIDSAGILSIRKLPVSSIGLNRAVYLGQDLPVPIESISAAGTTCFNVAWATNTTGKAYTARIFALLWDAEVLARMPQTAVMPEQFFGVR